MVATLDRFRRRGLGMALTWTALEEGRRAGMATGVLQASEEGQPVYERLGFEPCGRFVEYTF
jgi:predicted acetyltransferase